MSSHSKVVSAILVSLFAAIAVSNAFADVKKNAILDAFVVCDAAALKGKSGAVSKSVIVKSVSIKPQKAGGVEVKMTLTKSFEDSFQSIKKETGIDLDAEGDKGAVIFQHDTVGVDNFVTCELKQPVKK